MTEQKLRNSDQDPRPNALTSNVLALLKDESVKRLPQHQQGPFIVNRFTGDMVAKYHQGLLNNGSGETPVDMLQGISDATVGILQGNEELNQAVRANVSYPDVRLAVIQLRQDPRTANAISAANGTIHNERPDSEGRPQLTLTSRGQVEGYLLGMGQGYREWRKPFIDEVQRVANSGKDAPGPQWSTDPKHPGTAEGMQWSAMASAAREEGVDLAMLDRTAEYLKGHPPLDQAAGAVALQPLIGLPDTFNYVPDHK